jgi:hypothetical protein
VFTQSSPVNNFTGPQAYFKNKKVVNIKPLSHIYNCRSYPTDR